MAQMKKRRSSEKRGYALKTERGERPFQYSGEYQAWRFAVGRGDDRAIQAADKAWRARFNRRPIHDAPGHFY